MTMERRGEIMANSQVVYVARVHWLLFFNPLLVAIFSLFLGIHWALLKEIALILFIVALLWAISIWLNYYFSSLTIEKNRVIFRTGILVRKTTDITLNKIESVDIRQSIIGSIMQYGTLTVVGTGGTKQFIDYIEKPLTCRRYIEQLMQEKLTG